MQKKTGDFDFSAAEIRRGPRNLAAKRAALEPALGRDVPHRLIPYALAELRRLWRDRLVALRDAGWVPAAAYLGFMRNCPPICVKTAQYAFLCNRPAVCPFCHGRSYVLKGYDHLAACLPETPAEAGWVAVSSTHTLQSVDVVTSTARVVEWVARATRQTRAERGDEVRALDAAYAAVLTGIAPTADGRLRYARGGVHLAQTTPAELAALRAVPPNDPLKVEYAVHPPTSAGLVEAFARAFPYRATMLTWDPHLTAALLDRLAGRREFSTFGRPLAIHAEDASDATDDR